MGKIFTFPLPSDPQPKAEVKRKSKTVEKSVVQPQTSPQETVVVHNHYYYAQQQIPQHRQRQFPKLALVFIMALMLGGAIINLITKLLLEYLH